MADWFLVFFSPRGEGSIIYPACIIKYTQKGPKKMIHNSSSSNCHVSKSTHRRLIVSGLSIGHDECHLGAPPAQKRVHAFLSRDFDFDLTNVVFWWKHERYSGTPGPLTRHRDDINGRPLGTLWRPGEGNSNSAEILYSWQIFAVSSTWTMWFFGIAWAARHREMI